MPAQDAESTREAILRAAVEAIERDGESAVRVLEVARVAGYSVRMIYYFFGDREGLIEAARVRQFVGRGMQDVAAIAHLVESVSCFEEFRAGVRRVAELGMDPTRVEARLLRASVLGATWKRPRLGEALRVEQERVLGALQVAIVRAQERGFIDPAVDPRAFAAFMQAYSFGKVTTDLCGEGFVAPGAWVDIIVRFIEAFAPATRTPAGSTTSSP
ncbi:MAG: hypothetical protein RL653_2695 [Pseudomonadota bacterium]